MEREPITKGGRRKADGNRATFERPSSLGEREIRHVAILAAVAFSAAAVASPQLNHLDM
jgi:hypothetical protein